VPNLKKIQGLNLTGTPWATLPCYGMTFTFTLLVLCLGYNHPMTIFYIFSQQIFLFNFFYNTLYILHFFLDGMSRIS